jgi:hypothetical protein
MVGGAFAAVTPVMADPPVGLGFPFALGGGKGEAGIGLRLFSDDRQHRFVGTVGVDCMVGTRRPSPTSVQPNSKETAAPALVLAATSIGAGGVGTMRQTTPVVDVTPPPVDGGGISAVLSSTEVVPPPIIPPPVAN